MATVQMSNIAIISGVLVLFTSWCFAICLVYYLHRFYALKSEMIFIKRRGDIVVGYALCGIIILFIGYPSGFFLHYGFASAPTNNRAPLYLILETVHLIDIFVYYLDGMLILLRYWLIFYDIQFSNGCLNLEWKQCISESRTVLNRDKWYIQHRNTLGNQSYMIQKVVIITTVLSLAGMTMHASYTLFGFTATDTYPFLPSLLFLIMVAILIMIWRKMPFFTDKIYLYSEFKITAIFWLFSVCAYGCSEVIASKVLHNNHFLVSCLAHFLATFAVFIVPFVSTFWVLRYIKKSSLQTRENRTYSNPEAHVKDILNDEAALNIFMQHLIKEFSVECLLSIIEFQQFKSEAIKAFDVQIESECVAFSDNVPKSDIVYAYDTNVLAAGDTMLVFKTKAYKLYEKYIQNGSHFEINISALTRQKLNDYMQHYEEWVDRERISQMDLVQMFDRSTEEMFQLLTYSQSRMQHKEISTTQTKEDQ